jgi:hypothetical protein
MCHVPYMTKYLSLLWRHSHLTGFIQIRNRVYISSFILVPHTCNQIKDNTMVDDRDTLIFKKKTILYTQTYLWLNLSVATYFLGYYVITVRLSAIDTPDYSI